MPRRPLVALLGVLTVLLGSLFGWASPPAHAPTPAMVTAPGTAGEPVRAASESGTEETVTGPVKSFSGAFAASSVDAAPEFGRDDQGDPDDLEDPEADDPDADEPTVRSQGLPGLGEPGRPDGEFGPPSAPALTETERMNRLAGVLGEDVSDGEGTLRILPGEEPAPDADADRVIDVQIEVEDGLPVDEVAFGAFVMGTLNDERSWPASEAVSFARTDAGAEFRVVLASPDLVDEMCAPLRTIGEYSCGRNGHAALNALRWVHGADAYLDGGGNLAEYRRYLVNHEVGHLLGYPHEGCPSAGEPAPIMVQQSIDLDGCAPSAWVEE